MDICKVVGSVVSTNKTEKLNGLKLMVVKKMDIQSGKEDDQTFISIDAVGAGEGEVVMVVKGSSARQTPQTENKPVDAAIIAIIDSIEIEGKVVFKKYK